MRPYGAIVYPVVYHIWLMLLLTYPCLLFPITFRVDNAFKRGAFEFTVV